MTRPRESVVEHEHAVVCAGCGGMVYPQLEMTGLLTHKTVAKTYGPLGVCAACWFCEDYEGC